MTKFVYVLESGHECIVKMLLDFAVEQNHPELLHPIKSGTTALLTAAHEGHHGVVKLLLEDYSSRFPELLNPATNGVTALHMATITNHYAVVALLLDYSDRHPEILDLAKNGVTALHLAAAEGHYEIAGLLLDRSKSYPEILRCAENGVTALYIAVRNDRREVLQILLANKDLLPMLMIKNHQGNSPFAIAKPETQEFIWKTLAEEKLLPVLDAYKNNELPSFLGRLIDEVEEPDVLIRYLNTICSIPDFADILKSTIQGNENIRSKLGANIGLLSLQAKCALLSSAEEAQDIDTPGTVSDK